MLLFLNAGSINSLCAYVYINVRNYRIEEYKYSSKQAVHVVYSLIFLALLMHTPRIVGII